jgi:hypothetical protein
MQKPVFNFSNALIVLVALIDYARGLSRSRRAAAAENFTTPPPPKNACRRADAAAADILFGAPPKRCCHVHFSISVLRPLQ